MSSSETSAQAWQRFFAKHSVARAPQDRPFLPTEQRSTHYARSNYHPEPTPRRAKSAKNLRGSRDGESKRQYVGSAQSAAHVNEGKTEEEYEESKKRLKRLILIEGVPHDDFRPQRMGAPIRPIVWKLLLDVRTFNSASYLSLVAKGPSPMHDKISNDVFRTLATDESFKERVNEGMLFRLLDAFVWKYWSNDDAKGYQQKFKQQKQPSFSYVQGMNVLAAPFLYVMPSEVEAFECFCNFIERCCPTYVQPTLTGVHRGLELLDRCLQFVDPSLFNHLRSKGLRAELYAFPSVLTLCSCTPPLTQTLELWDYLLAFGTHLSILCIVAQLLLIRDELVASSQPNKLLRQFPILDAKSVKGIATTLVRDLDDDLYDELVRHVLEL